MKSKLLNEENGQRTFAIVFNKGDEFIAGLKNFAEQQSLHGSHFTAIGAFNRATLGYFKPEKLDYQKTQVEDQAEVLSLVGNIVRNDSGVKVHAHGVLGRENGNAQGGHILEGYVWPTLEVILIEEPGYLWRTLDEKTGLALIDLDMNKEGVKE